MKCENCQYWEPTEYGMGKCDEIKLKIEPEIITGYEGAFLHYYETDSDFGCVLFKEK